jgi:hypothetical protein
MATFFKLVDGISQTQPPDVAAAMLPQMLSKFLVTQAQAGPGTTAYNDSMALFTKIFANLPDKPLFP